MNNAWAFDDLNYKEKRYINDAYKYSTLFLKKFI